MQKVGELSRGGGGDGIKTEACSLIENSGSGRQPVKMSKYWSDVDMWRCTDYKTGCAVLDSEVCRPKTEGDQPRESCSSQCMRVQEKQKEFWWQHQRGSSEQYLIRWISNKAVLQMKLMCSFIDRSLSRQKLRFLTKSEKEMVVWQTERGAGTLEF